MSRKLTPAIATSTSSSSEPGSGAGTSWSSSTSGPPLWVTTIALMCRDYRSSMDADAVEIRVLGCLIEKQRTTPDSYPLSLNALRLACNQSTNRDPVVEYDEPTIRQALERLDRKRWARLASGA